MPSTRSLLPRLAKDFPEIHFTAGTGFHWRASEKTVSYDRGNDDAAALLHEVAHAVLGHESYQKDIQLIEMERDAWHYAVSTLAARYDMDIDDDTVQDSLDTYRAWLHARSLCPTCQATGIQVQKSRYACLACSSQWRVNEARICQLRRYRVEK